MNVCSYTICREVNIMSNIPNDALIDKMEAMLNVASDSTRLKILYTLFSSSNSHVEKSVSEIVEEVGASQSLISHQLKVLKDADLIDCRKEGLRVYYYLKDEHVYQLVMVVQEHVLEREGE